MNLFETTRNDAPGARKLATQSQSSAKVLVRNILSKATKNIIKSMFDYGRVRDVKFRGEGVAVVENVESMSVVCALECKCHFISYRTYSIAMLLPESVL